MRIGRRQANIVQNTAYPASALNKASPLTKIAAHFPKKLEKLKGGQER